MIFKDRNFNILNDFVCVNCLINKYGISEELNKPWYNKEKTKNINEKIFKTIPRTTGCFRWFLIIVYFEKGENIFYKILNYFASIVENTAKFPCNMENQELFNKIIEFINCKKTLIEIE